MGRGSDAHVISKSNETFRDLVDDLGDGKALTMVIGAGASLDAGLPSWSGLLRTLLEDGFRKDLDSGRLDGSLVDIPEPTGNAPKLTPYQALANRVIDTRELIEAATLARLLHGQGRDQAIRTALYAQQKDGPPIPGRIYLAAAALCSAIGPGVRVITTNYDDTLERAIASYDDFRARALVIDDNEAGGLRESRAYPPRGEGAHRQNEIDVVHLHGLIPHRGESDGALILDERDFAVEAVRPPGEVLPGQLDGSKPALFLGLSLTDPNIVAACHQRQEKDAPWYGLFVARGKESPAIRTLSSDRLRAMSIEPLHLKSFGQISQVMYELMHRVRLGRDYWSDQRPERYGKRFTRWHRLLTEERWPGLLGGDAFPETHRRIHEELVALLKQLRRTGGPLARPEGGEHFGLHLWIRTPTAEDLGFLDLIGSSSSLYKEYWSLDSQRVAIQAGTTITAVDAIYYGNAQRRNRAPKDGDRWQAVIAVPVELSDSENRYLIGGVVTISSTKPMAQSALRLDSDGLTRELHEAAAGLLTV